MKKAILTCGLFSMMMILTSFTQTTDIGGNGNQGAPKPGLPIMMEIGGNGNQGAPKPGLPIMMEIGGNGNQGAPKPGL